MNLYLDIDETLLNPLPAWLKFVNNKLDIDLTEDEVSNLGSIQAAILNRGFPEDFINHLSEFRYSAEFNENLLPVVNSKNSLDAVFKLPNCKPTAYVTSRPKSLNSVTIKNLVQRGFPKLVIHNVGVDLKRSTEEKSYFYLQTSKKEDLLLIDDNIDLIHTLSSLSNENLYAISAFGPLKYYQRTRARELGISNLCMEWPEVPNYIRKLSAQN